MQKILLAFVAFPLTLSAQTPLPADTLPDQTAELRAVIVTARGVVNPVYRLPDVHNGLVMAGKKHEVVALGQSNANVAEKQARQVFAKVPGVFVYEMDGSGNQINISTRGLDPHRSWEYNVRQNGVLVNSDLYGYPASHFSLPLEGIERIELVRGTASLQYGAQFGGLINYVSRGPDTTRALGYEFSQTAGTFGLTSTYLAAGGRSGRCTYFASYGRRVSNGYRRGARSDSDGQLASVQYDFSKNLALRAEIGRSNYQYRIPGPLTDSMFAADPRQATRSRNYFNPEIYVPSLQLVWYPAPGTRVHVTASGVFGARNSVQFVGFATTPDAVNPATGAFRPRQVDIDNFNSRTLEARVTQQYRIGGLSSVLAGGFQLLDNDLHRRQLGQGTMGVDYDRTLTDPTFGRDLHFRTRNAAFFLENLVYLTPALTVSPGLRIEAGRTRTSGFVRYLVPDAVPAAIDHHFPLFGINFQYRPTGALRLYGGVAQAYRPVIFADLIPATALDRNDPDLRDTRGYNAELGFGGRTLNDALQFDVSVFELRADDRIGSVLVRDGDSGPSYLLKTNTGSSRTRGVEFFAEGRLTPVFSLFTATSWYDGRYVRGSVPVNGENRPVAGNQLESVPRWISRNGLQAHWRGLHATLQYSYVSRTFSDALNTPSPTPNGAAGPVPAYGLWDFNAAWRLGPRCTVRAGVSNLLNHSYFTKRPTSYPGPGVWPGDGRAWQVGVVVRSEK